MTENICTITIDGKSVELPVVEGTTGDRAIDISRLRELTGVTTLDPSLANTASCRSAISWIDGENGRLLYRGIPIETLAENKVSFVETAMLLITGRLPTPAERNAFSELLARNSALHRNMDLHFNAFPPNSHPMAIMSAMINAMSTHDRPKITDEDSAIRNSAKLMSRVRTIAAASYKASVGEPAIYPRMDLKYVENFMHMMFSLPYQLYEPDPVAARALNLFASASAGVCALWGDRHGGANVNAVRQLQTIKESGLTPAQYVARAKDGKVRIAGFGHRVYRNWDPRARVLRKVVGPLLERMDRQDPLLDIAQELEEAVLADDYFIERRLYPNVDFYSGIVLRALGIPLNMFTVMFAIGRVPGWIAHWLEQFNDPSIRICRPRQVYDGPASMTWVPREERS